MFDISNVKVVLNYVLEMSLVSNTFNLSFKPELVCCSFADHKNVSDHMIMVLVLLVTTMMTIVTINRSQDGVLRCCIMFSVRCPKMSKTCNG